MIDDIKRRSIHRSKIIKGQFDGLVSAIEEEKYCIEILTLSLAIQKSLRSLNKLVLENHLHTHVKEGLSEGTDKEKVKLLKELLQLYELSSVRG